MRTESSRAELLRHLFGALAHALGNLTSPVALIAQSMAAELPPARRLSAAGTLTHVADAMRDLTAAARLLRDTSTRERLVPHTVQRLDRWWTVMSPLLADMLPDGMQLEAALPAVAVSPGHVGALTLAVTGLTRALGLAYPRASRLTLRAIDDSRVLRLRCTADGAHGAPAEPSERWFALARAELRAHGGALRAVRNHVASWDIVLPLTEAPAHARS